MVKLGLWVRLEAAAGKAEELEAFVKGALPLAQQEPGTVAWFAVKLGPTTFAIFDVFADERGREAHLAGRIAEALMAQAPRLLAAPPVIEKHDVLAAKLG
ncbi:putative quinol monooxygenase [Sandaracinus amylolyticus]|uniref:Antibiotic biosynthesis monooxygenase n=1 Tax=Sandaracinus amylolyticus TaxID=927083 RepID=A0A0F6SH71_9BACT|nr:antibiotic biosynthesis monooxygenase [Sandaracinus amylolyticus]AKF09934.1 hypothetical protein DB32_007083 [Sandaracinus amylolyticus]